MPGFEAIGRWLVIGGIALVVLGGILWLLGRLGLNHLPGTIRIDFAGMTCFFPLLASIVVSVVLTLLLNLLARLLK